MGPKPAACFCGQPAKYRCARCPVRYCSVACYKTHKGNCAGAGGEAPAPGLEPTPPQPAETTASTEGSREEKTKGKGPEDKAEPEQLRRLTELKWPPEPDETLFSDPLRREDAKPLRHAELERIATAPDLRALLADPRLCSVLTALDGFQSAKSRHAALARLLGVDAQSLARPAAAALMERDSPPPLHALLAGETEPAERPDDWGAAGWWLGYGAQRVWVGPEERALTRAWADAVTRAIGGGAWGQPDGQLAWEI